MLNLVARRTRRESWGVSARLALLGLGLALLTAGGRAEAQTPCVTVEQIIASRGADGRVPIDVSVSSSCDEVFAIGMRITVPAGFTVPLEISGAVPELDLNLGAGGVVSGTWDLLWVETPAFPFNFRYTLQEPADWDGTVNVTAQALYRELNGTQEQSAVDSLEIIAADSPVVTLLGPNLIEINCKDVFEDPGATAEDNIDGDITNLINVTGAVDNERGGVYELTYQVRNSFGFDSIPVQRTVIVRDSDSPSIALIGGDINLECRAVFTDPGRVATDPCEGDISTRVVRTGTVDTNTPGTYTLFYNVEDNSGNAAPPVQRRVIVADTTAPSLALIGASSITVACGSTYSELGATATDSCAGDVSGRITIDRGNLDTRVPGSYPVTYRVTDPAGNEFRAVIRTVNVTDTVPPVVTLNGAADITLQCGTPYQELGATANDACKGVLPVTINSSAVNTNVPGNYTVTYRANDGTNAVAQRNRVVRVVDNTPPVLTFTGGAVSLLECGSPFVEPGVEATDNCDAEVQVVSDADTQVKIGVPGTYRVNYSATDGTGNTQSVSRLVVVEDNTKPEITLNGAAALTVECTSAYVDAGATATDACDGDLNAKMTVSGANVNTSQPGVYSVRYNVIDAAGNVADQVTRTVTVVDRQVPTVRLNGGNVTVDCGDSFDDPGATASDVCDGDLTEDIVVSGLNFDTETEGVHTVTYTVRDGAGNVGSASRTVTVAGPGCFIPEEGEGDVDGEGEGEPVVEDCVIADVQLQTPGSNVIVPEGTDVTTIQLSSSVVFDTSAECALPEVEVIYAIDGVVLGSSTNAEDGHPLEIELGLGSYFLTATAVPNGELRDAVSEVRRFSVLEGIDSNANGLLDNPFANMPGDGDLWVANVSAQGCVRRTLMRSWLGDGQTSDVTLNISSPETPDQRYTIRVRRDLIEPGEQGIIVATIGCSASSVLAPESAAGAMANIPAGLLPRESVLDLSIIVSSDDGATFFELDDASVGGEPGIELRYDSSTMQRGTIFRAYDTLIDGSSEGIVLKPGDAGWSRTGLSNEVSATGRLSADLSSLSLFGQFIQIDLPADLKTDRFEVDFGSVVRNTNKIENVVITNIGDAVLTGAASIEGAGYFVLGDPNYTLASGASATIQVQFTPTGEGSFDGALVLSGDPNGNVVVELSGLGLRKDSNAGCGTSDDAGSGMSDALVAVVVFGLLAAATMLRKRED